MVCIVNAAISGTITGPAGWTARTLTGGAITGTANLYRVFEKVAGPGEATTVSASLSVTARWAMVVLELPATAFDVLTESAVSTGTTYACSGVTTTTADITLDVVCLGGAASLANTYTWNNSVTTVVNAEINNSANAAGILVGQKDVAASTASGTSTATSNRSYTRRGFQIAYALRISGSGSATAPAATGAGDGTLSLTGAAGATAPSATGSGMGSVGDTIGGAGAAVAPAATADGDGTLSLTGTGAVDAPPAQASASGAITTGDVTIALPLLTMDLDIFVPATARDVTIGLPCLRMKLKMPAPYIGNETHTDHVTATLYDRNGTTRIERLRTVKGTWRDALRGQGSISFMVPLDDDTTPDITDRRVVKFRWWRSGEQVAEMACRIRSEGAQLAVDGRRWVQFTNQPGVLNFAGDAVIYPEQDITTTDATSRTFGFMSPEGPWYVPEDWTTPHGHPWSDITSPGSFRDRRPSEFRKVDPDAQWISAIDPNTTQPEFTHNYYRATLHLDDAADIEVLYAADNFPHFYIDGLLLASWDPPGRRQWLHGYTVTAHLEAGDHEFAVAVQNSRFPIIDGANPIAWICTVRRLKTDGTPEAAILLRSDTTNWLVHNDDPEKPGWHRAQVLHTLLIEAQDRNVYGPSHLNLGFGPHRDSDGDPWTDRNQFELEVGTVNLVSIIAQLTETVMDVGVDPNDMRIHAWQRRGQDLSDSVQLRLGDDPDEAGTLLEYGVESTGVKYNSVITMLPIKRWMTTEDTDSIADVGRVEAGLASAPTLSLGSGGWVARQLLSDGARRTTVDVAKTSTVDGPIPYVNYDNGDRITVIRRRNNGTRRARCVEIDLDFTSDVVKAWPVFVGDDVAG